ncbi:MAG: DUF3047 domain-containing protein [Nitrospira sp. SB0677_bin_15]|nr:DUF3047 domain-containing protein [Nitrospira sp. SB0677_bin_15]
MERKQPSEEAKDVRGTLGLEATQRRICFISTLGTFCGLVLLAVPLQAEAPDAIHVGAFSHARAGGPYPDSWKPLTFHKIEEHTEYSLVEDGGNVVLKAVSRGSSSGLTREVTIDPKVYPIVEWSWKIENVLEKGDVTTKEGDDYPTRLYITFAYDESKIDFFDQAQYELARLLHGQYPPTGALTYIWESRSPVGTMVPNPYTDRVQMIVLESGADKAGQWVAESRNVYEDYRKAFGDDPPPISGVAVMTDTDNTQESAVAYYGDITFKKE